MEDTLSLLRFNCPQFNCDYLGKGWIDLKKHVRHAHELFFCDLCTKYKKIFSECDFPRGFHCVLLTFHLKSS